MGKKSARNLEICRLRIEEGMLMGEIANIYNISRQRVYQILQEHGHYRSNVVAQRRREQVYAFIVNYKMEHDGVSPSSREIAKGCSRVRNWGIAGRLIASMVDDGLLTQPVKSVRTIGVVGGKWTAPENWETLATSNVTSQEIDVTSNST